MTTRREHPHTTTTIISATLSGSTADGHQITVLSKRSDEGPLEPRILIFYHNRSSAKYTVQLPPEERSSWRGPPTHYRHQRFIFSHQPHKPHCTGGASMAAALSRAPVSSSLFDSEEEESGRGSERAQFPPPSLPVFNSLMKFRSEEQRCKHSHTAVATRSPVCVSVVYLSISLSASLPQLIFDLVSV